MTRRKLTISQISLIAINLVPIFGVWFQGWDAARIFLFYCLETILIGIFHVIKMIVAMIISRPTDSIPHNQKGKLLFIGLFIVCFFIMHYGIFVFVQTSMFFAASGVYKGDLFNLSIPVLKELLGREGLEMMAIFTVFYIADTIKQLAGFRIEQPSDIVKLMFQPYVRIFIQQFVLIFGSMFLVFGLGKIFIVIFVLTRFYIDLFLNPGAKMDKLLAERKLKIGDREI